jgi:hypothetical protein
MVIMVIKLLFAALAFVATLLGLGMDPEVLTNPGFVPAPIIAFLIGTVAVIAGLLYDN